MSRTPLLAQDHVMAERKRREKLSRLFISLSTLIPGLKKLDKASVLEDAINHLKELQGRVKTLEEDIATNSVVSVKSSRLERDDSDIYGVTPLIDGFGGQLPEVEARVSDKHVLFRIHCEKHQGRIVNIFSEIEKLNLSILSHSVLPFGNNKVDVTVVAKIESGFSSTIDNLVRNLRQALLDSPSRSL
ncbi:hypothetical protein MLD38_028522 [Melastoma candidum]|uniref:Uncharacterized protein n=1 Tax=Melastoma candidum TaxID=119954 RepID=A0ACB9N2W0_9MYRT|nr:hypothetical protein MLD38_028522 [Melastoma candidum]